MESLDTTILNTAVPAISSALGVAPLSMKAVLASYTLSLAVFIPISGWMADRFGTRRVFASAIGLFTLGSFLCVLKGFVKDKIKLEAPDPKAAPDRLLVLSGPLNCRRLGDVKALPGP
jgi:MFS family permease